MYALRADYGVQVGPASGPKDYCKTKTVLDATCVALTVSETRQTRMRADASRQKWRRNVVDLPCC